MAKPLRYPIGKLNETSDFLKIGIIDYKFSGLTTTNESIRRSDRKTKIASLSDIIFLPIPSNIQDGNSVSFGPGSLDGLTAQVLNYALRLMNDKNNTISEVPAKVAKALNEGAAIVTSPGSRDYFLRGLATAAANLPYGGNLTSAQLLAREKGEIINPNMELLFEGVTLRSFKFSFKMTPREPKEAEQIIKIINSFKKNMCPSGEGSLYLKTPKVFELTYMKGGQPHQFLHKFKQCALTDMSVNYTGEGIYATYSDGSPISYIMDLSFKELEPIYAGDYSDSDTSLGF